MMNKQKNLESIVKALKTLFGVIVLVLIIFFIGAAYLVKQNGALTIFTPIQLQNFESVIIVLSLLGIPAGHYYHKRRLLHLSLELPIETVLLRYRSSFFVKLAILEGLSMLSLIGYMLSGNGTFLIIYSIYLLVILINFPSRTRIADDLRREEDELFK